MIRKLLLGLILGCAIGGAQAQTPSPANVGIVSGTPDVFKLLDHTGAWATFGSVDPTTHVFTPAGGGGGGGTPSFPQTVIGGVSGGIPYFSSTTTLSASPLLQLNAFMLGGGAGNPPKTTATGAGVVTAVGNAVNTPGGMTLVNTVPTVGDYVKWASGGIVDGGTGTGGGGGSLAVNSITGVTGMTFSGGGVSVSGSTPNATISIPGGGGGSSGITGFATHAALLSGTTAYSTNTLMQQGFAAVGVGAAFYDWDPNSYCPGGISGSPTTADQIVCILPSSQSASTVGRYILRTGDAIDVRTIGMQPSTPTNLFDNAPYIPALLLAQGGAPPLAYYTGKKVIFPTLPGQSGTIYYFTKTLDWSRNGAIYCDRTGEVQTTTLAFAPGIDGIILDTGYMSPDGGESFTADVNGCHVWSQGGLGRSSMTNGSTAVTGVSGRSLTINTNSVIPQTTWEVGDGIIAASFYYPNIPYSGSLLMVPQGDYITAVSGTDMTLAQPAVWPSTAQGVNAFPANYSQSIVRLPVEDKYSVNTTAPVNHAATASFTYSTQSIPVASCTGVTLGAFVMDTTISAGAGVEIGVVARCSGTTLLLQANSFYSSAGSADNLMFTSNIVQMTGGPQILLMPSDFVWNDAFPFGYQVSAAWNMVSNAASGTTSAPGSGNWTINLSSACPSNTGNGFPGLDIAPQYGVTQIIDTTTNTVVGTPGPCLAGVLTIYAGEYTPGITINSGDTLSIPVYSTSLPLATAAGHQTLVIGSRSTSYDNHYTASVTHTGGSGRLWKLPGGIVRRTQGYAHNDLLSGWVFGIKMGGSSGTFPNGGGNTSLTQSTDFAGNLIGYLSTGDNSAALTSMNNLYGGQHLYDIVEAGTLGSAYFGDNTNSAEAGSAPQYGQVIGCESQNSSSFFGMYASGGFYQTNCLPPDGTLNAPPYPIAAEGGFTQIQPEQSVAEDQFAIGEGVFKGNWRFAGPLGVGQGISTNATSFATAPGSTTINASAPSFYFPGLAITDLYSQALSATVASAGTGGGSGTCTFTVQGGFPVTPGTTNAKFSAVLSAGGLSGTPTLVLNGNYFQNYYSVTASTPPNPAPVVGAGGCSGLTGATVNVVYDSAIPANTTITAVGDVGNSLNISQPLQGAGIYAGDPIAVSPAPGYGAPVIQVGGGFQSNLGLAFTESGGGGYPVQFQFNGVYGAWAWGIGGSGAPELLLANPGNYLGYTPNGTTAPIFPHGLMLSNMANLDPGPERLVDMGPAIPADAWHKQGDVRFNTSATIGAPAGWIDTADGANFQPFGTVGGVTPVTISSLPSCSGASGVRATVSNGIASPTYHQAVSTTGSTVQPVACTGGTGWVYD